MDTPATTVSLSELANGVTLTASELTSGDIVVVDELGVAHLFGPPIEATVVDDGSPPFSKRVTVHCECSCGQVLARYTGALRLTATRRGGVPQIHLDDGVFVTNCQRPKCEAPQKGWPYEVLAVELRAAWDEGRRHFLLA